MKENNMLRIIKCFASAVFSTDSTAKFPLPPKKKNVLKIFSVREKKHNPSA
jgi:hypothetical protein